MLTLVEAPDVLPVTLEEMKGHIRVTTDAEDDLIESFIRTATQKFDGPDGLLGRALITQTWRLTVDRFDTKIKLPLSPLQSVASVKYLDGNGVLQTTTGFTLFGKDTDAPYLSAAFGVSWPSPRSVGEAVQIDFVAGYGDASEDVPEPLREAIRLWAGHLYDNREAVITASGFMREIELGIEDHIRDYRVWRF